ncbi:MAG: MBL fold metallo-hydrolase [Thermoanaerobaculia bacterium]|nr:MBL fold metallo-hydrolase [Thermoanaerobaculia bacterium]
MRALFAALTLILVQSPPATSQDASPGTTTRSSVRAREVLNAAAQAHGGLDKLRGVTSLHRTGKGKTYTQGQNLGPDTPAIVRDLETDQWLDFAGNRARVENKLAVGGIPVHNRNVLSGDSGYNWNAGTGASTRFTPTGGVGLRNALRRDPARLIANALGRAEAARFLGTEGVNGKPHDVLVYAEPDGTLLTLYFDAGTHLLRKVETLSDTAVLGDTLNEQIYADYRAVDGVKVPFRLTVRNARQVTQEMAYSTIDLNAAPDAAAFQLPSDLLEPSPTASAPIVVTTIGPGLHLIGGGTHNSLAAEFADHVVVVDAPLSSERSRAVLDKLKELAPGKPVRSVVNTHYHFDHSGGLREYVADGATVITHASNADFVRKMAAGSRGIRPDRLSGKPAEAKVQTVSDKLVLSDGTQTIEIHALPNTHSNGMLVVYAPKEKALFNADLWGTPLVGPLPVATDYAIELREGIRKLKLPVEKVAPSHGRVATIAELDESVKKRRSP